MIPPLTSSANVGVSSGKREKRQRRRRLAARTEGYNLVKALNGLTDQFVIANVEAVLDIGEAPEHV